MRGARRADARQPRAFSAGGAIDDALSRDVLIAERLNGQPLDADRGAPARLVSPGQYGCASTKYLSRIVLHSCEPARSYHPSSIL